MELWSVLEIFLRKKYPDLSSSEIKQHIDAGACLVNGKIEKIGSKEIDLKKDRITLKKLKDLTKKVKSKSKKRIIFEDEHILVYDKEACYPSTATNNKKKLIFMGS